MESAANAALGRFVADVRHLFDSGSSDEPLWKATQRLLVPLLENSSLRAAALAWPPDDGRSGRYSNYLLYEDPDHGFVINALVKAAGAEAPVHDHGHTWTVYGVLHGDERILRYRRVDDSRDPGRAELQLESEVAAGPGFAEMVKPGEIHAEVAGRTTTVAIIVRSERVGDFLQNMYDPATGSIVQRPGPLQIPLALG